MCKAVFWRYVKCFQIKATDTCRLIDLKDTFIYACRENNITKVRACLDLGVDVNVKFGDYVLFEIYIGWVKILLIFQSDAVGVCFYGDGDFLKMVGRTKPPGLFNWEGTYELCPAP